MLFEQRIYTLKPGTIADFWQAQRDRGFELVRPILERQVGYFSAASGAADQVVHLYRYDDFNDWQQRLHGLYGVSELEPYFKRVRALMLAQENKFLVPVPVSELCPYWGNGKDWLPDQGALLGRGNGAALVEEQTTVLLPGTLPFYWQAWREHGFQALANDPGQLLGCFSCLVGRQHQVVMYRLYFDWAQRQACIDSDNWQPFLAAIQPLVARRESKLLTPAIDRELSPLFF